MHHLLFRDSFEHLVFEAPLAGLLEGPSCTSVLTSSTATSGWVPLAVVEHFVASTGLGPMSSAGIELRDRTFSKFVTEGLRNHAYILQLGRLMQDAVSAWARAFSGPMKKHYKEDA